MVSLAIFVLFGLIYGAVLQRSGFCFARAGFELFLLRSRDAFNGVIAALLVGTLGLGLVSLLYHPPQGHLLLLPFGVGTAVGATIFGLGMSLTGMCAAGTLLRLGEGYVIAWVSLAGILLGAALDPFRAFVPQAWQLQHHGLWLGERMGVAGGCAATLVFLLILWRVLAGRQSLTARDLVTPTVIGGALLGLVNSVQAAVATPWTVAYPLGLVPPALSGHLTAGELQSALPLGLLDLGLVVGAALSLAAGEKFRLKWPRRGKEIAITLAGGILMGWGIQLGRGCSIGGAFSALASLSVSGWIFFPCLLFGAWLGAHVMRRLA